MWCSAQLCGLGTGEAGPERLGDLVKNTEAGWCQLRLMCSDMYLSLLSHQSSTTGQDTLQTGHPPAPTPAGGELRSAKVEETGACRGGLSGCVSLGVLIAHSLVPRLGQQCLQCQGLLAAPLPRDVFRSLLLGRAPSLSVPQAGSWLSMRNTCPLSPFLGLLRPQP